MQVTVRASQESNNINKNKEKKRSRKEGRKAHLVGCWGFWEEEGVTAGSFFSSLPKSLTFLALRLRSALSASSAS